MHGAFSMPKSSNRIKKKRAGIPACGGLCVCADTNRTRPALEEAEKEWKMSITFAALVLPHCITYEFPSSSLCNGFFQILINFHEFSPIAEISQNHNSNAAAGEILFFFSTLYFIMVLQKYLISSILPRIPPAYGAGEPLCPFPGFVAGGRPSAIYMARGRFKRPSVGERAPNSLSTAPCKKRLRNNPKPLALFLFYQYSTFKLKNRLIFFSFFSFQSAHTGIE